MNLACGGISFPPCKGHSLPRHKVEGGQTREGTRQLLGGAPLPNALEPAPALHTPGCARERRRVSGSKELSPGKKLCFPPGN